jgi:OmpA-OmpF porin, OOP family
MRPLLKYLLPLLFALNASAQQNLVPNGSFEEYKFCPDQQGQIENAFGWIDPLGGGSSDYYNVCYQQFGFGVPQNATGEQIPKSGNAYAGLFVYPNSEYITIQLNQSLHKNNTYCLTFYVSLVEDARFASNNLGAVLTADIPTSSWPNRITHENNNLVYINSDTVLTSIENWTMISGSIVAKGGENYLTIGNINYREQDDSTYMPGSNTHIMYAAYYYVDEVSLVCCDISGCIQDHESTITLFPNPAKNTLTISTGNIQNAQVELFDISGRKLFQQNLTASQQSIDVSGYANGIYIFAVTANGKVVKREKVIISH